MQVFFYEAALTQRQFLFSYLYFTYALTSIESGKFW